LSSGAGIANVALLKAMARWRISFHDSGMGRHYHFAQGQGYKFSPIPALQGCVWHGF
jgi:hypothetical protein